MANAERVVVKVVPVRLFNESKKLHAARITPLGLTAYAKTPGESWEKAKQMFGAFVRVHRKYGTLESRLNESHLEWCYESEYKGPLPVERIEKTSGKTSSCASREVYTLLCDKVKDKLWKEAGELVLA